MTLESAILTRWLPWAAILQLIAFVVLWRALGLPRTRGLAVAMIAVAAAEAATLSLATRQDPDLELALKVGFIATVCLATVSLLWYLWSRCSAISARRCALLLGIVLLAFYLAVLPYVRAVQPTVSDEPHYLIVTQSIVLDGDIDLANDYAGDRYLQFTEGRLREIHGIHVGDRVYSIRDLGLPLIAVPGFAFAGRTGVLAEVCLVGAYLIAMLLLLMRDLGLAPRTAVLAGGAAGMLHPIATYTTQISPELFAAALFATALYALRRGRASSLPRFTIASACMGLIGIFSTRAWFIALGVGLCLAYFAIRPDGPARVGTRLARLVAAGGPFALLLLATSATNCWMFPVDGGGGCYFMPSAGYFLLRDQQQVLSYAPHVGVTGLLFDRTFGLISHTPLYVLAFVGLPSLVAAIRSGRAPWLVPLAVASLILVVYIGAITYWWADGAPPSRYLVVTMPLWVVGLGYGLERLRAVRWGWLVVLGALVPSAIVSFIFLAAPYTRYDLAVDIARTGSPGKLWEEFATWFHWNGALLFPSIPRADRSALLLSLVWWAIALAFVELGVRLRRAATAD